MIPLGCGIYNGYLRPVVEDCSLPPICSICAQDGFPQCSIFKKCPYVRIFKEMEKKCPKCGSEDRRLIDTCIIYDKYYICKKCGYCDFSFSLTLSRKENKKRMSGICYDFMPNS